DPRGRACRLVEPGSAPDPERSGGVPTQGRIAEAFVRGSPGPMSPRTVRWSKAPEMFERHAGWPTEIGHPALSTTCSVCRTEVRRQNQGYPGHLMILVTRPAPTVRPPSRIANLRPSSIAIGWMSATVIAVL